MKNYSLFPKYTRTFVVFAVLFLLTTSGCSGGGVDIHNPTAPPADEQQLSSPAYRAPEIEPIDSSNPIPLYFIHQAPA